MHVPPFPKTRSCPLISDSQVEISFPSSWSQSWVYRFSAHDINPNQARGCIYLTQTMNQNQQFGYGLMGLSPSLFFGLGWNSHEC